MPEIIAEYIDRAVTVECRPRGLPRGVTHRLYNSARAAAGRPLSLDAAERLLKRVSKEGSVIFLTGAGVPPWLPFGESDGPPGAAALARSLQLVRAALPVVLCAPNQVPPIEGALLGAGFYVSNLSTARQRRFAAVIETVAPDEGLDPGGLLDRFQPDAIVAIERLGANRKGVIHSILGRPMTTPDTDFGPLLEMAARKGILTIGIGDGGNELGFGRIADDVRTIQEFGSRCQCPCAGGIAAAVATDVLVVAAVSNWGAYAVSAMLAVLTRTPVVLHPPELEERILLECIRAGGADGGSGEVAFRVDGIEGPIHQNMVALLGHLVRTGLEERVRDF